MAFLLRLRRIQTFTNPASPILLRLFAVRKVPEVPPMPPKPIHTLTNPASLLRHHRLFSTSNPNPNNRSPSLLREVREAFKELSVREYTVTTPFRDIFPPLPFPAFSTVPSPKPKPKPKEADQNVLLLREDSDSNSNSNSNPTSSTLDDKLEQLKLKALSLKHRRDSTDVERLSELFESQKDFMEGIGENVGDVLNGGGRMVGLPLKMTVNQIDNFIVKLTRLNEKTVEIMELVEVLTNSRLTSLNEIARNLAEIREGLQDDDVWSELNEELKRAQEIELNDFQSLAEDTNQQLVFFQHRINNLTRMRENKG